MVLWSPILQGDNRRAAIDATAYLSEPRAEHFWDTWSFGTRHYTKQLRYQENGVKEFAWDIFVLYNSNSVWRGAAPEPAVWMQHRALSHGLEYSPELLEKELLKLLR